MKSNAMSAITAVAVLSLTFVGYAQSDDACLHMTRTPGTTHYTPGAAMDIYLNLESGCTREVTTLGIEETLPEGWSFISGEALEGPPPVQWGAPDMIGRLEIFWINVPDFPIVLRYQAMPPENAEGQVVFTGQVVFSLNSDSPQRGPEVITTLAPRTTNEGEEEGENEGEEQNEGEAPNEGEPNQEGEPATDPPQRGCCRPARDNRTAQNRPATEGIAGNVLLLGIGLALTVLPWST